MRIETRGAKWVVVGELFGAAAVVFESADVFACIAFRATAGEE